VAYRFAVALAGFDDLPVDAGAALVTALLEWLAEVDREWLARHPEAPLLYESGIRFQPDDGDTWQDARDTLERGAGDCEDLAAFRAGELRARLGLDARPFARVEPGSPPLYHALVRMPDGSVEDPSAILGMP
jgi:hypothetical protein